MELGIEIKDNVIFNRFTESDAVFIHTFIQLMKF